jgi:hypothetical protein
MTTPIQAYTTKDVAELFKIKPRTVRDYIGAGLIKAVPWVGKSWLIQPKEVERLQRVGINTNGLHAKLNAKRKPEEQAVVKETPPAPASRMQNREATEKYCKRVEQVQQDAEIGAEAPKALPAKVSVLSALASADDLANFLKPALSVEDTRFKTPVKTRKPAPIHIVPKNAYHGKLLTPNELKFIKWLQAWSRKKQTIDGTNEEWCLRCKGILNPKEIKNIITFLRAKRFLACDGCNTTFIVRNLDEFFTCPPVAGSALPKGYKYV